MKCRLLLHAGNAAVCAAGSSPYVPSVFETEGFCLVDRHRMCPFYCMATTDGVFNLSGLDLQSHMAVR